MDSGATTGHVARFPAPWGALVLLLAIGYAFDGACSRPLTAPAPVSSAALGPGSAVSVAPGDDLQAAVRASPAGTHFLIRAGRHRRQTLTPKDDMVFAGEPGAVLDGEGVALYAFETLDAEVHRVTIQGLVIRNYATPTQRAAIQGDNGVDWVVQDNEISDNAYEGLHAGPGMRILRNRVHHNGRVGISGYRTDNVVVDENQVWANNPDQVVEDPSLAEASGMKFMKGRQLVVRNNDVRDNCGVGIWLDHEWPTAVVENNRVTGNTKAGIWHEVGYDAIIRNNTVSYNGGTSAPRWLGHAGIQVSNSPNVQIYGNTVSGNANGIGVMQASGYTDGPYGPNVVQNLDVHANVVTMASGRTGLAQNTGDRSVYTSRNNRFSYNTYYLGTNSTYFLWNEEDLDPTGWQRFGHDVNGRFIRF